MVDEVVIHPTAQKIVTVITKKETRTTKGRPVKYLGTATTKDLRDSDGNYIVPILFETQCPFCGMRLQFGNNLKSIQCPHCKRGTDTVEFEEFIDPFCEPGEFDPVHKQVDAIAHPRIVE
jgi:hypothetical protein